MTVLTGLQITTAEKVDANYDRGTCSMLPINQKDSFDYSEIANIYVRLPWAQDATIHASVFTPEGQHLFTLAPAAGMVPVNVNCGHFDIFFQLNGSSIPRDVTQVRAEIVGFIGKSTFNAREILKAEEQVSSIVRPHVNIYFNSVVVPQTPPQQAPETPIGGSSPVVPFPTSNNQQNQENGSTGLLILGALAALGKK